MIAPVPVMNRCGEFNRRITEPDREWLWHHYRDLDKTIREIAAEVGCSTFPITRWIKKHGIMKSRESLNARHSKRMSGSGNAAWVGGTSQKWHRKVAFDMFGRCQWCGSTKSLEVHHMDHDRENGSKDNLTILCGPCNKVESWMWKHQQDGTASVVFDTINRRVTMDFTHK